MEAKKTFRGIQDNDCRFEGKVVGDPVANGDYMFLTLQTTFTHKDANNQFTDMDVEIPLMVEPGGPVNVVRDHIKAERHLLVKCQYRAWEANGINQHAFVVKQLKLGHKPYDGPINQGGHTPPLPQ
jgi:hypothetical protein